MLHWQDSEAYLQFLSGGEWLQTNFLSTTMFIQMPPWIRREYLREEELQVMIILLISAQMNSPVLSWFIRSHTKGTSWPSSIDWYSGKSGSNSPELNPQVNRKHAQVCCMHLGEQWPYSVLKCFYPCRCGLLCQIWGLLFLITSSPKHKYMYFVLSFELQFYYVPLVFIVFYHTQTALN